MSHREHSIDGAQMPRAITNRWEIRIDSRSPCRSACSLHLCQPRNSAAPQTTHRPGGSFAAGRGFIVDRLSGAGCIRPCGVANCRICPAASDPGTNRAAWRVRATLVPFGADPLERHRRHLAHPPGRQRPVGIQAPAHGQAGTPVAARTRRPQCTRRSRRKQPPAAPDGALGRRRRQQLPAPGGRENRRWLRIQHRNSAPGGNDPAGQRRDPVLSVCRHRRRTHPGPGRDPGRRDLLGRHRFSPCAAQG